MMQISKVELINVNKVARKSRWMISMYVILIRNIYANVIYYHDCVKKDKELPKSSSFIK